MTEEENKTWTAKLRTEKELNKQLDLLRNRILADTNVYVMIFGDRVFLKTDRDKQKSDGLCRPLLIVDGQPIYINNGTPTKKIKELVNILTIDNIKGLSVADDKQATALYGSTGLCGLIALTPKNKKVKKELLRING
ncbi:hypothetical protein QWY31_03015 [Cytophagales bacterium LB-30]|uniref:TonB-dependent receptor plug domain-containing protein n=1 Tax=Shiella aurantiaca TaxID=3058365 RepID=A0ABT8F258_9BACT|nr:hypothetical protein [Shiella aurantiaca]